jgi:putative aldouronate transport system permease protein
MKKKEKMRFGDRLFNIFNYGFFGLFTLICIFPFYYLFINTISDNNLSDRGLITIIPKGIHFSNYIQILKIPDIGQAAWISLERTVLGTLTTVLASAILGYLFTKDQMWGRKFWYRFVVITMYLQAGIIPWYVTMRNLHLTDNFLGYILPGIIAPFNVILVKTFVESIPASLQEAAEIDGAGYYTVFVKIIFPLIKPILATIAIFSAVGQWSAFSDTLFLMTDSKLFTLQFVLYKYLNEASSLASLVKSTSGAMSNGNLANMQTATTIRMTISMVVVFPILFVYPYFQKYFVKGVMIGAVKG